MKLTGRIFPVGRVSPLRAESQRSMSGAHGVTRPAVTTAAFTLVEIALCIAIIGFALVAIIGVLPAGLNVQKQNREETIIVHEANYFIDAIRSGARGLDDLTNYVEAITNVVYQYEPDNITVSAGFPITNSYTYTNYFINDVSQGEPARSSNVITNGARIIGLLSTPRRIYTYTNINYPYTAGLTSNYIIAYVRALSGAAVEKVPQNNAIVRDLGFRYRLICELSPFSNWNTNWVNFSAVGLTPEEVVARSNYWQIARSLQGNMNELRLLFRWPVDSRGTAGNQRQVFRTLLGGSLTNQPADENSAPRWFLQSGTYQTPL